MSRNIYLRLTRLEVDLEAIRDEAIDEIVAWWTTHASINDLNAFCRVLEADFTGNLSDVQPDDEKITEALWDMTPQRLIYKLF
jgi:hypothetical protein